MGYGFSRRRPGRVGARGADARKSIGLALGASALALVAGWLCAPAAMAASQQVDVTVHQLSGSTASYFILDARPGRYARAGWIGLSNPTSQALRVNIGVADGLTASTLGSLYSGPSRPPTESATWLTLGQRSTIVPAHGVRRIDVGIRVPRSAAAGDYLSGVTVETPASARTASAGHGIEIGETYRYVVGVETTLPGPRRPHIEFTGASVVRYPSTVMFLLDARNDGDVILKGVHGSVTITQGSRRVVGEALGPGTFVTHSAIELPVAAPREHPSAGTTYEIRARLVYQGGIAYLDKEVTFGREAAHVQAQYTPRARRSGFPYVWVLLAAVLALSTLIGALLLLSRRRRAAMAPGLARRRLRGELARAQESGATLSVIRILFAGGALPAPRRQLAKVMRGVLRPRDAIGDLGGGLLVVMLPRTSPQLAVGLADELASLLARSGSDGPKVDVRSWTPDGRADLDQLLAEACDVTHEDDDAAADVGAMSPR